MAEQLDLFKGIEERDAMIAKALGNADQKNPGVRKWSDRALEFVKIYNEKSSFLTEDVRVWAHEQGLPEPPSARAWGGVMVRAARAGIIKNSGLFDLVKNKKAHRTPATIWIKN